MVGAGVAAWPLADLSGQNLASAAQRYGPVVTEVRRQLKEALGKMRNGQSRGARQLATTLRIYASTVNNDQLRAALRKVNRQQLLVTEMNPEVLARQAEELGIDPSSLPPRSLDRVGREVALDRLIKEGLSPFTNQVADHIDTIAEKMEHVERRSGGAMALQVALRQQTEPTDCGDCKRLNEQVNITLNIATVACAAAAVFPLLLEAAVAASATFLVFYIAYAICTLIVALCEAWYN